MNPLSWYVAGVIFAVNAAAFLIGVATITAAAAAVLWTTRGLLHPIARRLIVWQASRTAWRNHRASGRQVT